jgi:hypothetical protein
VPVLSCNRHRYLLFPQPLLLLISSFPTSFRLFVWQPSSLADSSPCPPHRPWGAQPFSSHSSSRRNYYGLLASASFWSRIYCLALGYHWCEYNKLSSLYCRELNIGINSNVGTMPVWNLEVFICRSFIELDDSASFVAGLDPSLKTAIDSAAMDSCSRNPPSPLSVPGYKSRYQSWVTCGSIKVNMGFNSPVNFFISLNVPVVPSHPTF